MSVFELFRKIEATRPDAAPVSHIICCLGNPGAKYAGTRHNAGFRAAEEIARLKDAKPDRVKFHGLCCEISHCGRRALLLLPQTYMNDSGIAAREALDWYKLPPERLIAVCDDMELPPGRLRVRAKGSCGGQRGLKSIIEHLGTEQFPRVRIGIGRPAHEEHEVIDYVLGKVPECDLLPFNNAVKTAALAALEMVSGSPESAAGLYNGVKFDTKKSEDNGDEKK